jgi:hypothetical protein
LSTWRIHISHAEELRENMNSNVRYCVLIIEIQRLDMNSGEYHFFNSSSHCMKEIRMFLENPLINDEEKTHWIVAR